MKEESLFAAALEKGSASERHAFLDLACGDDRALRQRLEGLLAAHEHPDGILERGPRDAATNSPAPGPPLVPQRIFAGRFKLRQKLGEGGMGQVWVADQMQPVQRRVALKIIRPGLGSTHMLARFDQERQALAIMDHPNIAKVFEAGIDATDGASDPGSPYFVMELIKGMPITEYCDAAKLSPRERLELFIPVCHAVQHAHQKGIIHRDLKPTNILVGLYDGKPVPKVIDFGVAKATGPRLTEQSIFTEVGALIGTLEYMSPEQAELNNLDIDTRSDIYSLGAVLYELLTGSVPFSRKELKSAGLIDMLRLIKEVEPTKPSTKLSGSGTLPSVAAVRDTEPKKLIALIRGELDWIVIKCLEKDRARRYQTASGLAMDLERYLADQIVEARPPSAGYRFRKFVRRNKGPVAASAALCAVVIASALAVAAVQAKANRERAAAAALRAGRESVTNANVAAAIRDARERVDEAWSLTDFPDRVQVATDAAVAAARRADDFAEGDPPAAATLGELASTHQVVKDLARHTRLLTASARNQQAFADDLTGVNVSVAGLALCNRQSEALRQFGLDPITGSVDEVARVVSASRLRDHLLGTLLDWQYWANLLTERRVKEVDPLVKSRLAAVVRSARHRCGGAYARWQELLDRNDVPGLVTFAASPDGLSFGSALASALGRDLGHARQREACRNFLRAAVERYPHEAWLHFDLFSICKRGEPSDRHEALRHISAASALRPDSSLFRLQLGACYADLGSYGLAVAAFRKSISMSPNSHLAYQWMAAALLKKKDLAGAMAACREVIRLAPYDPWAYAGLGKALSDAGKHSEALQMHTEGLKASIAAMRQDPARADDPVSYIRYNGACLANRCADALGENALAPEERLAHRKQARDFLTAELAAIRKLAVQDRTFVNATLEHWLEDDDLATVRLPTAIALLPPDERDQWTKFWTDVRALRDGTAEKGRKAPDVDTKGPGT